VGDHDFIFGGQLGNLAHGQFEIFKLLLGGSPLTALDQGITAEGYQHYRFIRHLFILLRGVIIRLANFEHLSIADWSGIRHATRNSEYYPTTSGKHEKSRIEHPAIQH
jgi:hypothetical protein